ncbi:hypothetical protein PMZ80_011280 [Knufia obscura]|uniref:Uncharacterized protein n=2 Tax=Trichomeriaceae TaxID=1233474 RepID=A0ABR0JWH9_9EURO|nr:hypothetical protein LTR24_009679 [Lithohypha guttulata]KAK5078788.1 hypothetical protein LTR51_000979 [Lithohypha guttulata]KAK5310049.1 hypothetical protein LTR70_009783 [Exophiala xenobiotica]KAK5936483.1 hypothetical protein PMZ80_011280 [Knufia obscura]
MAKDFLNDALSDDTSKNGYLLDISIYSKRGYKDRKGLQIVDHERIEFKHGEADWDSIISRESRPQHPEDGAWTSRGQLYESPFEEEACQTLVAVSADAKIRTQLRNLVCKYIENNVTLHELDYQPDER